MTRNHIFVCGDPALDFAATLRARRSSRIEALTTPKQLDAWYLESGLVDSVTPSTEADSERARAVREALHRLVTDRRRGRPYDETALAVVNDPARRPAAQPQLTGPNTREHAIARSSSEVLSEPSAPWHRFT
ncbi:ABATE domain-containing protein [Streptomyces sp. NPDC056930]|uniref:ABATE domain-containing protein n=1 Tax=Streptomyces sp. NPDC056930 TaxID=3345967 RepID=UPI00362D9685